MQKSRNFQVTGHEADALTTRRDVHLPDVRLMYLDDSRKDEAFWYNQCDRVSLSQDDAGNWILGRNVLLLSSADQTHPCVSFPPPLPAVPQSASGVLLRQKNLTACRRLFNILILGNTVLCGTGFLDDEASGACADREIVMLLNLGLDDESHRRVV